MSARVSVAFNDATLEPAPTWTELDAYPSLVASYTIDRGRQYELDRCDTGRATVTINDTEGILDPTNPAAALPRLDPLVQVRLMRRNPVTGVWSTRFRGFVEEMNYEFDPSQRVNRLTVELVDIFEIIAAIEMLPGTFGDPPPSDSAGQVFFDDTPNVPPPYGMQTRVWQVLDNAGIDVDTWSNVFSGNVSLHEAIYSAGESAMTAIQDACDAEFPSVGNVYGDRLGRLAVHGRYARFDPVGTAAATPGWDFHDWKAGDAAAVHASPTDTAHIRTFGMNRGLSKIVNQGLAIPIGDENGNKIPDDAIEGQRVDADGSIALYGIRPWSAQGLLTKYGITDALGALDECQRFAEYYVSNYKAVKTVGGVDQRHPIYRVPAIGFRSMHPDALGAEANWAFLCTCDIADRVTVTVGSPGGGGFPVAGEPLASQHLIEGVHEEARPLQAGYDDVTLTLDLSPFAYQENNPFPPLP